MKLHQKIILTFFTLISIVGLSIAIYGFSYVEYGMGYLQQQLHKEQPEILYVPVAEGYPLISFLKDLSIWLGIYKDITIGFLLLLIFLVIFYIFLLWQIKKRKMKV